MGKYVLHFNEIDKTKLTAVGGKGVNLGELYRLEGIRVPEGFCVTTAAYREMIGHHEGFAALLDQLALLKGGDRERIAAISQEIRNAIAGLVIGEEIAAEIRHYYTRLGEDSAYAVRSSATAEDLPHASFAGQQDTYLNIRGAAALLLHITKCWASLFADRAVSYRIRNGFGHRQVYLAVVVQRMICPEAAGIMFTADPVTANRKVLSIDAGFGLGEALVSGLVNPDIYQVREGRIVDKKIAAKKLAVYALPEGGTAERELPPERQKRQVLPDGQILQLARLGRKIEAYFGRPQDIEWCLFEDAFHIVQSRPITTLFPVPESDAKNRVYASLGHQQMMTDAMKPLGISFFRLLSDKVPIYNAGGRLFMDLTHDLASPIGRTILRRTWGMSDPLMWNAILRLMKRKEFMKSLPHGKRVIRMGSEELSWSLPFNAIRIYLQNDAAIVQDLISRNEASIRDLERRIANRSGDELLAFIEQDQQQLKEIMYNSQGMAVIFVGLYAVNWINRHIEKWLGEKGAADKLSQAVANNVTSEMGLALLDVADVVRQYPAVLEYLQQANDATFFTDLALLAGGDAVSKAIRAYLEKYGMRCTGEIDITRPRWSEQPTALIPMILSNINNFAPNGSGVKFNQGRQEAAQQERELIGRLAPLPGGKGKAKKTKKMISRLRNFIGYREYPKYAFIQRYWIYKQALLKEAAKLVQKGVIREKEDLYYLSFEELREAVRTSRLDYGMITKRKADYDVYEKLTPPRVMTSEGEVIPGEYDTGNLPPGALPGLPVSSGVMEGRARVVRKLEEADLAAGDILVTAFTDPSWTPVFVSAKGLVTEVGGLMTHGAVIAREYGLPAVVGVENATRLIEDGQRIRVNGTEGYVEMLRD